MSDDGFNGRAGAHDGLGLREGADDALLQEVGAMLRSADPVPPHVLESARGLLTWRALDDAMSQLLSGAARPVRRAPTK